MYHVNEAVCIHAYRSSVSDLFRRAPELAFLREKNVAVFGLGCVGAPSALEFARAGVSKLWLIDDDPVDPATVGRWPLGLSVAGLFKCHMLAEFVDANYPFVNSVPVLKRVGQCRDFRDEPDERWLGPILQEADLIYDATSELGVRHFLSDAAFHYGKPFVYASGTVGGWGGEAARIAPGISQGCWMCLQHMFDAGELPAPQDGPDLHNQPAGCGDPTFAAAGFDMLQVAVMGVRLAIATLSHGLPGAYPAAEYDGLVASFRDGNGKLIAPRFDTFQIRLHPECERCSRDTE